MFKMIEWQSLLFWKYYDHCYDWGTYEYLSLSFPDSIR